MLPRWLVVLALFSAACKFDASGLVWLAHDLGSQPPPPAGDFRWPDQPVQVDLAPPGRPRPDRPMLDLPPPVDVVRPGQDLPVCGNGLTWCGSYPCVDLARDNGHCGACNRPCGSGQECCGSRCADTGTDDANCGRCANPCTAPDHCSNGTCTHPAIACASGTVSQAFSAGMWGCKGTKQWQDRGQLCSAGFHVCSATEWVQRRGTLAPTHIYWTNDFLYADSWYSGNCVVRVTPSTWCGQSGWPPMRVCNGKSDAEGNTCNWTGCGFLKQAQPPGDFFGGCQNNYTAGALCCL